MVEARHRPTALHIDLDALRHNVGVMRNVAKNSAICAVVKANAYGHGAVAIATAALQAGAAGFAVAIVDEGVQLREANITAPILVLSDVAPEEEETLVAAGLTATISSIRSVIRLSAAARRASVQVPVHICVNTGMHREGAQEEDVAALVSAVGEHQNLRLEGIWTHFAVADEDGESDEFTKSQIAQFEKVLASLPTRPQVVHAANSAATLRWPSAHYDMVRTGIVLYGINPAAPVAMHNDLRPVVSLRSEVAFVRDLPAGERPSYGRSRALVSPARIATIPIGYADGIRRELFDSGAYVLINGKRCPLAGRVSMDQIVVACDESANVSPDDEVVLIGNQGKETITVIDWARWTNTIGYEVVCDFSERLHRITHGDESARWSGLTPGGRS